MENTNELAFVNFLTFSFSGTGFIFVYLNAWVPGRPGKQFLDENGTFNLAQDSLAQTVDFNN